MKDIAEEVGFGPVEILGTIKTQWGTGKLVMEGNPVQSCSIRWTPCLTEMKRKIVIISNDLVDNLISIDFTCNSVMFDPMQEMFIDPSGYGLHDIQKKLLRIPVAQQKWDLWYSQNKRKPFRYWKMKLLNYSVSSNELHDFLCQKTVESIGDDMEKGAEKLLNVICKSKQYRPQVLSQFKRLFCEEMTEAENRSVIQKDTTQRIWKAIMKVYEKNQ